MLSNKLRLKSEIPVPSTMKSNQRVPFERRKPAESIEAVRQSSWDKSIALYSTCPQSFGAEKRSYVDHVRQVARWSESFGYSGILVYTDNSLVDPWLVSRIIVDSTEHLCPLVAVQPAYMHPYSVAKMIASFAFLHGRRICLNMVAGGFKNDLAALNDMTPHDKRYTRLIEYTLIIKDLLSSSTPVSFTGEFYKIDQLKITPSLPPELFPEIFVSGSSESGLEAAKALGAIAVKYPKPASQCAVEPRVSALKSGIRVGIIARESSDEAWEIAEQRFPEDRKGELTHQLAMKVSDSLWHKQLSETADHLRTMRSTYWLRPFELYKTFCPYLVGDYEAVGLELSRYIALGYRTFILDVPPSQEDLRHTRLAFDRSLNQVALPA